MNPAAPNSLCADAARFSADKRRVEPITDNLR
jgi:hypothetical protein